MGVWEFRSFLGRITLGRLGRLGGGRRSCPLRSMRSFCTSHRPFPILHGGKTERYTPKLLCAIQVSFFLAVVPVRPAFHVPRRRTCGKRRQARPNQNSRFGAVLTAFAPYRHDISTADPTGPSFCKIAAKQVAFRVLSGKHRDRFFCAGRLCGGGMKPVCLQKVKHEAWAQMLDYWDHFLIFVLPCCP